MNTVVSSMLKLTTKLKVKFYREWAYTLLHTHKDRAGWSWNIVTFIAMMIYKIICIYLLMSISSDVHGKSSNQDEKPAWAKKNIRDYTEADLERLFDQWEEDEEPLEPDELPEHLRPQPQIDFNKVDMSNPENLLKLTKKGRTLMTFVSVAGGPTRDRTEELTKLWQTSLWNNHIQAERYLVDDDRAIFLFKDGAQAWEAKEYLIDQEECKEVVIESKSYHGKHTQAGKEEVEKEEAEKPPKKSKKKVEL